MANDCYNELRIRGDVQQLKDRIHQLVDTDDVLSGLTGVKYEDHVVYKPDVLFAFGEDIDVVIVFNSRWSPVREFVDDLCKKYKINCFYHYSEPNMDFAGSVTYEDGEFVDDEEYTELEYMYHHEAREIVINEFVEMIEEEEFDLDDLKERYPFFTDEDWNEIELKYNANKFNL